MIWSMLPLGLGQATVDLQHEAEGQPADSSQINTTQRARRSDEHEHPSRPLGRFSSAHSSAWVVGSCCVVLIESAGFPQAADVMRSGVPDHQPT